MTKEPEPKELTSQELKRGALIDGLATLVLSLILGGIALFLGYTYKDMLIIAGGLFIFAIGIPGSVWDYHRHLKKSRKGKGFFL